MGMKNWNESRMPKEMKRVEDAQKNQIGQEQVAECADEPSGHGKRLNNKQAMDTHGSGVRTRLRHHQLVPSQYKSGGPWVKGKRGYGLVVGRRGEPILGSYSNSFGGNVLLG